GAHRPRTRRLARRREEGLPEGPVLPRAGHAWRGSAHESRGSRARIWTHHRRRHREWKDGAGHRCGHRDCGEEVRILDSGFWILAIAAVLGAAAIVAFGDADAQRVDPRRAASFVVGTPGGAMPMQRVDARRSGASKQPLPSGSLQVAWRKTIGLSV